MARPISLHLNNDAIAEARATLKRLDADTFKQREAARIRARAWSNVSKGKQYARLQREAKLEARRALNQIWRAFLAYDKARNLAPSSQEYELRDDIERTLKRMAGLT
jgi:hypothetical protein